MARVDGRPECAAVLRGAAEAIHEATGRRTGPWVVEERAVEVPTLVADLGEVGYQAAIERGQAMTVDRAVRYALEEIDADPGGPRVWPS